MIVLFESKHPDDNRPRLVIEAAKEFIKNPTEENKKKCIAVAHAVLAGRAGVQEYVVRRYKKDRSAALRNAKIRLSNIKLNEIVQVMRGKSKWIKH